MGYRIEYDRSNGMYEISKIHSLRFPLIMMGILGFLLLFILLLSPEMGALIRSVMIPGEDAVTVQAIHNLTDDLRSGATVSDAVEAFCRYVIHGR